MKARPPFELSIGSLVLEGVEQRHRKTLARAFHREFERLVRERPIEPSAATEWRLPPLRIAACTDDPAPKVGKALARELFEALQRAAETR